MLGCGLVVGHERRWRESWGLVSGQEGGRGRKLGRVMGWFHGWRGGRREGGHPALAGLLAMPSLEGRPVVRRGGEGMGVCRIYSAVLWCGGGGVARVQFLAILARHTPHSTGRAPTRALPGAAPPPRGATRWWAASNPPHNGHPQALPNVGQAR